MRPYLALLALLGSLVVPRFAHAQDMDVALGVQVPIFAKMMTFDRQLRARASGEVVVAVAYQSGNRVSTLAKDEALKSFSAVGDVDGIKLTAFAIDLDRERLGDVLEERDVMLLYVTPLRAVDIGTVAATARDARVTTMTGVPRYVSLGLGVGVANQGGRPRILVNLEACRLEGAEFGAELLKLAQIVK